MGCHLFQNKAALLYLHATVKKEDFFLVLLLSRFFAERSICAICFFAVTAVNIFFPAFPKVLKHLLN